MINLKKSLQNKRKQGKIKQVIIYSFETIVCINTSKLLIQKEILLLYENSKKRIKGREEKINGVRVSPHTFAKFFLLNGGDV